MLLARFEANYGIMEFWFHLGMLRCHDIFKGQWKLVELAAFEGE